MNKHYDEKNFLLRFESDKSDRYQPHLVATVVPYTPGDFRCYGDHRQRHSVSEEDYWLYIQVLSTFFVKIVKTSSPSLTLAVNGY